MRKYGTASVPVDAIHLGIAGAACGDMRIQRRDVVIELPPDQFVCPGLSLQSEALCAGKALIR